MLLHGGPGFDHSAFRNFCPPLAECCQLVYYDHRSMGRSDRTDPATWRLATWADDLRDLLDVLGIERPILFGQSFGGFVAMRFAIEHGDRLAGLVLSSTAARHVAADCLRRFRELGGPEVEEAAAGFFDDPGPASWARYREACLPAYNTTLQPKLPPGRQILAPEVLFDFWRGEHATYDLRPELAAITCPVAVVHGGLDPITPPQRSHEILEALTATTPRHLYYEYAGHGVYRDEPSFLARDLPQLIADLG